MFAMGEEKEGLALTWKKDTLRGDLGSIPASEEEMATPSSILAWRIPQTEDPGGV